MTPEDQERYSRQILFAGIGEEGQRRLLQSSAVIVGCGALGTALAGLLVRAGVGRVRIIDRDFVEPSNLQRQTLFSESDARASLPKAVAAERHLRGINSGVAIEGTVTDLTSENALELLAGFDLILDGADNFETRFLLNDAAISLRVPWVYGAAVGSYGVTMAIIPGETACLACLAEADGFENARGAEATCDTAGILNSAAGLISSLQAAESLKLLADKRGALHGKLISCDVWTGRFQSLLPSRDLDCRACVRRDFIYLEGDTQPQITMCGRNSVQIHERRRTLDLDALAARLAAAGAEVQHNHFLLRFLSSPHEVTIFADGRAIIKGTRDPAVARSLYARFIGA